MAAKNTYELTYIINPVRNDDQIKGLVDRVTKYIDKNDGDILDVDEWGNRRMAYQIDKKRSGYYVNMYFRAPGSMIAGLERSLHINDDILRYLTLRLDKKMLRHLEKSGAEVEESAEEAEA